MLLLLRSGTSVAATTGVAPAVAAAAAAAGTAVAAAVGLLSASRATSMGARMTSCGCCPFMVLPAFACLAMCNDHGYLGQVRAWTYPLSTLADVAHSVTNFGLAPKLAKPCRRHYKN